MELEIQVQEVFECLARDLADLGREDVELVDHVVDRVHEVQHLARDRHALDLLRQVPARDRRRRDGRLPAHAGHTVRLSPVHVVTPF